jgi:ArsR family transcriptional regulator
MSMQDCRREARIFARDVNAEAALFKALGDPARMTILATLARNEHDVCVCDFTCGLGLNQSTVSHHLKLLKDAGLVTSERRGTWVYYALASDAGGRLAAALSIAFPEGVPA